MINRNDLGHWRAAICDDCFAALANLGNHSAGMLVQFTERYGIRNRHPTPLAFYK